MLFLIMAAYFGVGFLLTRPAYTKAYRSAIPYKTKHAKRHDSNCWVAMGRADRGCDCGADAKNAREEKKVKKSLPEYQAAVAAMKAFFLWGVLFPTLIAGNAIGGYITGGTKNIPNLDEIERLEIENNIESR